MKKTAFKIFLFILVPTIIFVTMPVVFAQTPGSNECNDSKDNDSDTFIDKNDPQCAANQNAVCENGKEKYPCIASGDSAVTKKTATGSDAGIPLNIKIKNPLKVDTIQGAIKLFMDAVLRIALPFIVIFFIWSGVNFILARGNKDKISEAKKMFWYTIVGTLLILGAWTITNILIGTVNSITG